MELVQYFGADRVVTFMLLFARMSGLMIFFPFYGHNKIPVSVKTSLVFILTVFLFPMAKAHENAINFLVFEILSELFLGLCAGLFLNIIFASLQLAGEQISMVMGFSMATVLDPQTNANSPIIANIINFMALLTFLILDGHHILIQFYAHSLTNIELGVYYPKAGIAQYLLSAFKNLFLFGFILSFPIIALSLLSDLIFGMLMKSMPQFNLLVVGYPIKITIGFAVLIAIIAGIMQIFIELIKRVMNDLPALFF